MPCLIINKATGVCVWQISWLARVQHFLFRLIGLLPRRVVAESNPCFRE